MGIAVLELRRTGAIETREGHSSALCDNKLSTSYSSSRLPRQMFLWQPNEVNQQSLLSFTIIFKGVKTLYLLIVLGIQYNPFSFLLRQE